MPKRPLTSNHGQHSNPAVWTVVIVCTIMAIAIIISGIAVFSVYLIYRPKMPYLVVAAARLNNLNYDDFRTMDVDMSVAVLAENTNSKVDASFSDVALSVRFHGMDIAHLQASLPFEVERNSSRVLNYPVRSTPIPLDRGAMNEVTEAINRHVIDFSIYGKARTRWKVGIFLSVKFWTYLSCRLQFSTDNGTAIGSGCSSKTH